MAEEARVSKFTAARRNLLKFFKDVRSELKKVIWPNREQLINNTLTVLMSCLLIGGMIWVVDAVLLKVTELVFVK